jgi:hypothetical protein
LPKLPAIYGQNIPSVLGQQNVALTVKLKLKRSGDILLSFKD